MSMTEEQAGDLIDAAVAMQAQHSDLLEADPDLADAWQAYTERLKALKDGKIRAEGFRVIGATHVTIREGIQRLDSRIVGVHEDVAGWMKERTETDRKIEAALLTFTAAMQGQEAAVNGLRAEFHERIDEVGESVSQLRGDVGELRESQGGRLTGLEGRVGRVEEIIEDFYRSRQESKDNHTSHDAQFKEIRGILAELQAGQKRLEGKG